MEYMKKKYINLFDDIDLFIFFLYDYFIFEKIKNISY